MGQNERLWQRCEEFADFKYLPKSVSFMYKSFPCGGTCDESKKLFVSTFRMLKSFIFGGTCDESKKLTFRQLFLLTRGWRVQIRCQNLPHFPFFIKPPDRNIYN